MKYFICVALLIVSVLSAMAGEIQKDVVLEAMTTCQESEGASDDDFEDMKFHRPAANQEAKCMRACVMKHFNLMNDDGKMDRDRAIEICQHMIADEDMKAIALEVVDACESLEVDDDHCEAAVQYGNCVTEKAKELGLDTVELS